MKHLLYIIGEPGAGKSTLAAEITKAAMGYVVRKPFGVTVWEEPQCGKPVYELGLRRGDFSGTDALSMSVQPKVIRWLELMKPELVFGEGDRLASESFFRAARGLGYELAVVFLEIPAAEAAGRRLMRALQMGRREQDEKWIQGRRTKAHRLAEQFSTYRLDALSDPAVMVEALRENPVVGTLTKEASRC